MRELNAQDFDGYVCSIGVCITVNEEIIYRFPFPTEEVECVSKILESQGIGYTIEGEYGNYYYPLGKIEFKETINEKRFKNEYDDFLLSIGFYPIVEKRIDVIYKFAFYKQNKVNLCNFVNALNGKYKVILNCSNKKIVRR